MAIMIKTKGTTVHTVALTKDNQKTSGGTHKADMGRIHKNCKAQHTLATLEANPTKRMAPMRCTSCPLMIK
jgi:hypothetical protein